MTVLTLEEKKQFMVRLVEEVINKQNLDAIDDMVAEDFIEHVPLPGQGPGPEGLKYAIGIFINGFPDIHWEMDEQIAEGDTVVSRFSWDGHHQGEFLGIPPTKKYVRVWGVVIDVVRNGKFSESRLIMDLPGLFEQLGAAPA